MYEVEPFETTKRTSTRFVSVIALNVTFELSAAEFGEAYVNLTLSLGITLIRQVAAPVEVYAVIVTYPDLFVESTTPPLTLAIDVFEDFHFTPLVVDFRSTDFVLLRLEILLFEILTLVPFLTVILQLTEFEPDFAVILAVPAFLAVTTPLELTVATDESELLQVAELTPVA